MRRRWFAGTAIAAGAVLAVLGAVVGPAHAAERDSSGLVVSPERALFDVTLFPGESARAVATLSNRSDAPLAIGLTPVLSEQSGSGSAAEALTLAARAGGECTSAAMVGAETVGLGAGIALDEGVLRPRESVEYCLEVAYPDRGAQNAEGISVVEFSFTGIERPPAPPGIAGIALTGAAPPALVTLGCALLVLFAGALTVLGSAAMPRGQMPGHWERARRNP